MNQEKFNQEYIVADKEKGFEVGIEKEKIKRNLKESQASYLQRAGELVTQKIKEKMGKLFDPARAQEKNLPEDIKSMIADITLEARKSQEEVFDSLKNEKTIKAIEEKIGFHDKGDLKDSESFDKTQRGRKFFEIQPGAGAAKRETYWNTLFFPYNTEATRIFAKNMLDDKRIVLLGGGRSKLGKELQEQNINPREIVNVDPFVENVEEGADRVIPLSASDENFVEKISKQGIESADEIWAEYSVPAYLENPKEIEQLIKNIDTLLAVGGSARIWPVQVGGRGQSQELIDRKNSLVESLKKINATNEYEIILYEAAGRPGFILRKLTPSKEELQKREDQEQLKKIREQI